LSEVTCAGEGGVESIIFLHETYLVEEGKKHTALTNYTRCMKLFGVIGRENKRKKSKEKKKISSHALCNMHETLGRY